MRITENLQQNFPFISVLNHVDQEYVGIIINQDNQITSMYDYSLIKSDPEKSRFIELGEAWWWNPTVKFLLVFSLLEKFLLIDMPYEILQPKILKLY